MAEPSTRDYIRLSYAIGLREAGDVKPAGNLLRQLLTTARLADPYRASALMELGITEAVQGRGRQANRFADEALAIALPDAQRLHALVAAGHIAHAFRDRKRARLFFEQARLLAGHSLTADHPDLGPLHSGLGLLNEDDGHPEEAEKHYREALRIAEKSLDPFHPELGTLMARLAAVCERQGKTEADTFRLRAQSIETRNSLTVSARALRSGRE